MTKEKLLKEMRDMLRSAQEEAKGGRSLHTSRMKGHVEALEELLPLVEALDE